MTVADYMPLYYAALAPAYLATKRQSIWSRFTAMRLVSALFGGIAAAFVYLLVAELVPRPRWPAVAAGLFVAFQPMFAFISGVINNDAGGERRSARLALYLAVRALRRGLTTRPGRRARRDDGRAAADEGQRTVPAPPARHRRGGRRVADPARAAAR